MPKFPLCSVGILASECWFKCTDALWFSTSMFFIFLSHWRFEILVHLFIAVLHCLCSGLLCKVSAGNDLACLTTNHLAALAKLEPRLVPLVLAFRYWARVRQSLTLTHQLEEIKELLMGFSVFSWFYFLCMQFFRNGVLTNPGCYDLIFKIRHRMYQFHHQDIVCSHWKHWILQLTNKTSLCDGSYYYLYMSECRKYKIILKA